MWINQHTLSLKLPLGFRQQRNQQPYLGVDECLYRYLPLELLFLLSVLRNLSEITRSFVTLSVKVKAESTIVDSMSNGLNTEKKTTVRRVRQSLVGHHIALAPKTHVALWTLFRSPLNNNPTGKHKRKPMKSFCSNRRSRCQQSV